MQNLSRSVELLLTQTRPDSYKTVSIIYDFFQSTPAYVTTGYKYVELFLF